MHTQAELALTEQPRVTMYPRVDAAEFAFTVQVGGDWATVRWKPSDDVGVVARRLRDVVAWLESR